MEAKLTGFSKDELVKLANLLADFAMQLEDDGNEDSPDAALVWNLKKQIRTASK